jgi:uncharacterized protein (TIGR03437 family)
MSAQTVSFNLTTVATKTAPQSLVTGDFNGDGKPDLAVTASNGSNRGTVEILLGNGDGTFHSSNTITLSAPATYIVQADFNHDGKLDLAVSTGSNGEVMVLLGNGDGSFQPPADSGARTPAGQLSTLIPGLAVGDINGDGKPDLVLGPYTFTSSSSVAVLLGNGDGTFQSAIHSSLDRLDSPQIQVADLNGDGRADVFITGWSSSAGQRYGELLGNAGGTLTPVWSSYTYSFSFPTLIAIHDVNGNGKPDVIVVNFLDYPWPGLLRFYAFLDGSLNPTGLGFEDIPEDSQAGLNYVSLTAADVTGDGKPDLLLSDEQGNLLVMRNNGDGTFSAPSGYPPASPAPTIYTGANQTYTDHWRSIATADFRGVGKQDVVIALANQNVALLENSAGAAPVVTPADVRNAASLAPAPAVPGSLMAVFGSGFAYASGTTQAATVTGVGAVPDTLFGLTMQASGIDAPLLYASPAQANIQIPWELAGQTQATFLVTRNGVTQSITIPLAAYAPGIFTTGGQGTGQAAALIVATSPVIAAPAGAFTGSRPIHPGEYLSLYATGLGAVNSPQFTNQLADCCYATPSTPLVTVGGVTAAVQFSGLAPSLLGVYQVNIQIPANAPAGDAVPVALSIGGASSNTVTIAIQ